MKRNSFVLIIMSFVLALVFPVSNVLGAEVPFTVEATIPDNQASGVSYFDLLMEPGQEQDLEVLLHNHSDEDIEIVVEAHSGVTNANGVIVYNGVLKTEKSYEATIFDEMSQVAENRVVIPANDTTTAIIHVKAPEESFDGLILGGIHFLLEAPENDGSSGVNIQHQYAYVIGVNIQEEGNTEEIEAILEIANVEQAEVYGNPGVLVTVNNLTPAIISNANLLVEIYSIDEPNTPLLTHTASNFSVAPSLAFTLPISLEESELPKGDYQIHLTLKNDTNNLKLEGAFSITTN